MSDYAGKKAPEKLEILQVRNKNPAGGLRVPPEGGGDDGDDGAGQLSAKAKAKAKAAKAKLLAVPPDK